MSGGYKVDIDELGRLIRAVEDAADDVRGANKKLAEAGEFEKLGDGRLEGETQEF